MRIDAIQAVNAGNEASLRGATRTESNISTAASRIRITLNEQETILDRAKTQIDQLNIELAAKQKSLIDEHAKVARFETILTGLNETRAQLIEKGDNLHAEEIAERNNLYMEVQKSEAFAEARDAIYNRNDLNDDEKKKEDARHIGRVLSELNSKELAVLLHNIDLNDDEKVGNQNDIIHYKKLIELHTDEITELSKRVKEIPRLIIAEKETYSDAAAMIKQLDTASKVLARTAAKFDATRLHPEISDEQLLKLQADEENLGGKEVNQQILAAMRPAMLGGRALIAALGGERETAIRLAAKTIDFDVESAPQLNDPVGKPILAPDSVALSGRDRRQDFSKETRRSLREKLMAMGRWVLRSNPKGNGFDFEVIGTTQQSLTTGHED